MPPSVLERELLDELAAPRASRGQRPERRDVDLDVEVARVGEDRAVLHALHVLAADDALVAGRGHEDVADLGRLRHRQHLEAVHDGLERLQRVDLGDDHVRAHALARASRRRGRTSRSRRRRTSSGEQHVRRADDAVDRRLAGAVAVVEQVLRLRLVDGDDREAERAVALQRLQPDDAGRRLLGAADDVAELLAPVRVEHADHVGAVVHRDLRLVVDRGLDVLVVRVVVLALDREDGDVVLLDERGRDVVLRRQRVRRAEDDVGAAGLQRAQRGSRSRSSRAGRPRCGSRRAAARARSARGSRASTGMLPVGPLDPAHALAGECEVLHVVASCRGHQPSSLVESSPQATSSRSCLRCSQSTQRVGAPACRAARSRPRRAARARAGAAPRTRARRARRRSAAAARASDRSWFSSRTP